MLPPAQTVLQTRLVVAIHLPEPVLLDLGQSVVALPAERVRSAQAPHTRGRRAIEHAIHVPMMVLSVEEHLQAAVMQGFTPETTTPPASLAVKALTSKAVSVYRVSRGSSVLSQAQLLVSCALLERPLI